PTLKRIVATAPDEIRSEEIFANTWVSRANGAERTASVIAASGSVHREIVLPRGALCKLNIVHCAIIPLVELAVRAEGKAALKARETNSDLRRVNDDTLDRNTEGGFAEESVKGHLRIGRILLEVSCRDGGTSCLLVHYVEVVGKIRKP